MGSAAISFHCLKIGHLDNDKEWVGILVSRYQDTNGVQRGLWTLTMPVEGPYFLKAPRGVPAGGEALDPGGDGGGVAAPAEGELLPRPRLHAALHRHARAQGHRVHPLLPAAARRRVCRS